MAVNTRILLRVDVVIQRIIGVIMIFCVLFGVIINFLLAFALLALMAFGAWQILSGVVFAIITKSKKRITYIGIVIVYFLLAAFTIFLIDNRMLPENGFLFFIGVIIIPLAIGIWYYLITVNEYEAIKLNPDLYQKPEEELPDILDDSNDLRNM